MRTRPAGDLAAGHGWVAGCGSRLLRTGPDRYQSYGLLGGP